MSDLFAASDASTVSNAERAESRVSILPTSFLSVLGLATADCPNVKLSGFTVDGTFSEYVVCLLQVSAPFS